jgi:hypothetical protein
VEWHIGASKLMVAWDQRAPQRRVIRVSSTKEALRRGEERGGEGEREGKRHVLMAKSNVSSKGLGVE